MTYTVVYADGHSKTLLCPNDPDLIRKFERALSYEQQKGRVRTWYFVAPSSIPNPRRG